MRSRRRLLQLLATAGLPGCAAPPTGAGWVPGQTTEAQVLAERGAPVQVWPEADGGRTLEYSTQPLGRSCLMLRFDAAGRLVEAVDTLQAAQRLRVVPGMSAELVSRRLGRERSRVRFALSGEEVWDWTVPPEFPDQGLRFNVHFVDGLVVRTSHSLVLPEDRHWPAR